MKRALWIVPFLVLLMGAAPPWCQPVYECAQPDCDPMETKTFHQDSVRICHLHATAGEIQVDLYPAPPMTAVCKSPGFDLGLYCAFWGSSYDVGWFKSPDAAPIDGVTVYGYEEFKVFVPIALE